jgi:hypothetical protein
LLSHNVGLTASYNHFDQDSNIPTAKFKVDRVSIGVTLQL